MQKGINRVTILGNLGKDPEVKSMPSGTAVANITLATSETWNDKQSGEKKEKTEWHRVVFFGKLAEIVGQYLKKGSKIYIEGKLQTRKWQGQDGQDRYTTEIVVDMGGTMQMLDSRPAGTTTASATPAAANANAQAPAQTPAPQYDGDPGFDQDVPF